MTNIFEDTKTALGVDSNETVFDIELTMHIGAAIDELKAIGVTVNRTGSLDGETWAIFNQNGNISVSLLDQIKQFVFISTRIVFDPPLPSIIKVLETRKERLVFYIKMYYDMTDKNTMVEGGDV